jgi:predicted RNA-binding Zn ribbon-like protein
MARPAPAELVTCFANTLEPDTGSDGLADVDGLRAWLTEHDLLSPTDPVDDEDLALARALRGGLREAFGAHHDGQADAPELTRVAGELPLRAVFDPAGPRLAPVEEGARGAVAAVLAAAMATVADGTWPRLKLCADATCRWAFLDESRNRSRTWCAMGVCGNRAKTRAYRSRRRTPGAPSRAAGASP